PTDPHANPAQQYSASRCHRAYLVGLCRRGRIDALDLPGGRLCHAGDRLGGGLAHYQQRIASLNACGLEIPAKGLPESETLTGEEINELSEGRPPVGPVWARPKPTRSASRRRANRESRDKNRRPCR